MSETHSSPVAFYYMKEGHYYRPLGLSSKSGAECFVPDNHSDGPAIREVKNKGVDGLVSKVTGIILSLPFWTFETKFGVSYIPDGKERFNDMIHVGGVDVAGKDSATVIREVQNLVNVRLQESA